MSRHRIFRLTAISSLLWTLLLGVGRVHRSSPRPVSTTPGTSPIY